MNFFTKLLVGTLLCASAAQADPFRIIVTGAETPLVPNSVLHLAESEGYFDRAGVEVELVPVEQTPMAIAALRGGNGEMANISVDGLFGLYMGGVTDLKAVGSTDKSIPFVIAARKGVTLENMDGQRFGVGRRNSLDYTLSQHVLQESGVDPLSLQYLPLGQPTLRAQALAEGRIDATTMSIGVFLSMPNRDEMQLLVDVDDYFNAVPVLSKVNVVSQETIAERSDELDAVLEALTLAARDYAATPGKWVEAMAKARPDIDRDTLERLSQDFAPRWTVNGGLQAEEMDFTREWTYRQEKNQNADVIAPGAWADLAPMDRVLDKIGVSDLGDAVTR